MIFLDKFLRGSRYIYIYKIYIYIYIYNIYIYITLSESGSKKPSSLWLWGLMPLLMNPTGQIISCQQLLMLCFDF